VQRSQIGVRDVAKELAQFRDTQLTVMIAIGHFELGFEEA
jgi:hypothetical protein